MCYWLLIAAVQQALQVEFYHPSSCSWVGGVSPVGDCFDGEPLEQQAVGPPAFVKEEVE